MTHAMTHAMAAAPALRRPQLGQGLVCAALAGVLLLLSFAGPLALLPAVLALQLLLLLGFIALVDLPASQGGFLVGAGAAVAADVVVLVDDGQIGALPGVVGLSLVAGFLHQLLRRDRSRVVESLAGTLVGVTAVTMAACLLAAPDQGDDAWPFRVALLAAGVTLVVGRIADRVVHHPPLTLGASRGWPGLLLALGSAVAAASLLGHGHLPVGRAALTGLVAAATVAALDLLLDLVAAELAPLGPDSRRVHALRPVSVLLPLAGLGPVALLVARSSAGG